MKKTYVICDICDKEIDTEMGGYYYSKTKRKHEVYVHKECFEKLYARKGKDEKTYN